jgi:phage terminase large subunit-like protein
MPVSITLYSPHHNQAKIHNSINSEPYKYYVLNIGRQFGKSLLAMNQCYYWAFNEKGVQIAWVSPIYKQAKKVFDEMVKAFDNSNLITSNASELIIKTKNNSTIQFFSAERYDNLRGFTFDYLVCDEFAFIDERAWTEVLRATVLVKGKKVLLISTPKGKNHFYNLFNLDGVNPAYKSFKMTSYDGLAQADEIDGARHTLPDNVFRQEYLAEFIDSGSGVFTNIKINNNPQHSNRYFAGIDLGRADDYTVLTILNEFGEMVFCERWRHNTWSNIVDSLVAVLKRFDAHCFVEVNSIGDVIFEQIKAVYYKIEPFTTTSKSKQEAVESLQVAIQNGKFSMNEIDWLKKEFDIFTYEYSHKSRSIKYSAPQGFHDDGVMSCCIAYQCLKQSHGYVIDII